MNTRVAPPPGTEKGTLHWLHRPTGAPYWMVATWEGDGWNLMDGRRASLAGLEWWHYHSAAVTPDAVDAGFAAGFRAGAADTTEKLAAAIRALPLPEAKESTS